MVVVHSATKRLAAMTLAIAHSRGWLDYEERVATYWPEFAQHDKERVTVRQLLAHQAGLFAICEPVTRDDVADLDRLAVILARQRPAWSRARVRRITGSRSASTKASCSGVSIRNIARWGGSFTRRSPSRSAPREPRRRQADERGAMANLRVIAWLLTGLTRAEWLAFAPDASSLRRRCTWQCDAARRAWRSTTRAERHYHVRCRGRTQLCPVTTTAG